MSEARTNNTTTASRRSIAAGGLAMLVLAAAAARSAKAAVMASIAADDGPTFAEALAVFRELSDAQKRAALTMLERLGEGQSIGEAGLTFLTTCGLDAPDAERVISALPAQCHGDAR